MKLVHGLLLLGLALVPLGAEEPADILARSYLFSPAPVLMLRADMVIRDASGEKKRQIEVSLDKRDGHAFTLSRILQPAFLTDMKFLKRSETDRPDAVWLKTSRGVRRVGIGSSNESVFGSQFTVEDFGSVDAKGFELDFQPDPSDLADTIVLARPLHDAGYATRLIWVDRESGLIVKMEYCDGSGKVIRRYEVLSRSGSGRDLRPLQARMTDLVRGSSTTLDLLSFDTPRSLPEQVFSPGAL